MITKQQAAQSMARECDIVLHLFSKISPEAYGYRPSPEQRSTEELLRYLSVCGILGITCMVNADWKLSGAFFDRAREMPAAAFPAAMQRQKQEILDFFDGISEETLLTQEAPMPGGGTLPLGAAILNGPFKWLAAYKMQLFLYAKASGAPELKTANLWRGTDPKPAA